MILQIAASPGSAIAVPGVRPSAFEVCATRKAGCRIRSHPVWLDDAMKTLLVRTLDEWCDWLSQLYASQSEVWLIFHKRHTGVESIAYKRSVNASTAFV